MDEIIFVAIRFLLLLPCIVLHEVAHGYVAYLLGDHTAKAAGRLTLDPLKHIDLWGTLLMPILLLVASGGRFAFGYAKPVPVNPVLMRKTTMRNGMLLTGIAGPAANLTLAIIGAIAFRLLAGTGSVIDLLDRGAATATGIFGYMLFYFVYLNLVLVFFNLIPLPPLDGSRVVQRFLSGAALRYYESIESYGFVILLIVLWVVPQVIGVDVIGAYLGVTVYPIAGWLLGG